jgi:K+-transporting ATPase KdpF subunit
MLNRSACEALERSGEFRKGIEERAMNIEYLLTGLVALAIGVYLVVALLRPDKF